jgi:hypothetical protein
MSITVVDPLGNQVSIPAGLIPTSVCASSGDETDSPERVIQCPALLLSNCDEDPSCCTTEPCENHYLRLVNSKDTLLISARKEDGQWVAYNCMHNPSPQQLAPLLLNNKQLSTIP